MGPFGDLLGSPRDPLGPSWEPLGALGGLLGASWSLLGVSWESLGDLLEPSEEPLGSFLGKDSVRSPIGAPQGVGGMTA